MHSVRPLTVLHVAAPGMEGGLESVLLELSAGLRQLGHRVALAAVGDVGIADSPVLRRVADRAVEVLPIEIPTRAYLTELRCLRAVIDSTEPAVVHTHGYRADLLGGLAARQSGVPWVSTAHGFTGGDRKNRFYEWLQCRAYRRADAVVAVSASIRDRLARSGIVPDRIHLFPNAWAPKALLARAEARHRLGITEGHPVIGWVGRLTQEKGADVFLNALALIPTRHWRASIVGDGRERPALEAQARELGIADLVQWHGLVPNASEIYPAFDAWVLSSRTEGTPIALFEAMAARIPMAVTAVGGVPDVVRPAEALIVPTGRLDLLSAAMAQLLLDTAGATARAEAAYQRLVTDFSPPAWLAAHVALYRAVESTDSPGA